MKAKKKNRRGGLDRLKNRISARYTVYPGSRACPYGIFILTFLLVFSNFTPTYAATFGKSVKGQDEGLFGYWSFDGETISGTTVSDGSSNSNNGTIVGGAKPALGRIGQGIHFDNTDDEVTLTSTGIGTINTVTVTAWVRTEGLASYDGIFETRSVGLQGLLISGGAGNPLTYAWEGGADEFNAATGLTLTVNEWHFAAFTVAPAQATVYLGSIDGSLQSWTHVKAHISKNLEGAFWRIGRDSAGAPRYWNGDIDEVRFYNRTLTKQEIKKVFNQGRAFAGTATANENRVHLNDGLVGYWSFDGPDINGATAIDRGSGGNNGTLTNSPQPIIGRVGQALDFDGAVDYVTMGDVLDMAGSFTTAAWIKIRDQSTQYQNVIVKGTTSRNYSMATNSGGILSQVWIQTAGVAGLSNSRNLSTALRLNAWEHLVVTYDNSTRVRTVYLNGNQVDQETGSGGSPSVNGEDLTIGLGTAGFGDFPGSIDEARIYDRALSQEEVIRLYNSGRPTAGKSFQNKTSSLAKGLVGHWTFDGPTINGATMTDQSGQGNDGTLVGNLPAVAGRIGQSLDFSTSSSDHVTAGSAASLDDIWLTGGMSVSAWIRPHTLGGGAFGRIVDKDSNFAGFWYFSLTNTAGLRFSKSGATALDVITDANRITLNEWQHVVMHWDGSTTAANVHIYVNGIEAASYTTQTDGVTFNSDAIRTLHIGARSAGGFSFDGEIDDVRVYNRELTMREIQRLYNMGR